MLLKTYDIGETFIQLIAPVQSEENKLSLVCIDTNTYFFQGFFGLGPSHVRVHKSVDGGHTWTKLLDTIGTYYSFDMLDEKKGILVGTFGSILQTIDGWETITFQSFSSALYLETKILNEDILFIARFGGILRSVDGGGSWQNVTSFSDMVPRKIYSYTNDLLFVTANSNTGQKILKGSTDGGTTWSTLISGGGSYLYGIEFINENEGYITGYNYMEKQGSLLYTYDGGETWNELLCGYDKKLYEIEQANDSILLIGGEDGLLLRFNRNQITTGSREVSRNEKPLQVFPNPAANEITCRLNNLSATVIRAGLYDAQGQFVRSAYLGSHTGGLSEFTMNLDGLSAGFYWLSVVTDGGVWVEPVIKM